MKNYSPAFLYTPPSWFQPFQWRTVFGNDHPVEIDLGCGDGTFLVQRALRHPDRNFLGVERLLGRARKVDRKAQRMGLSNVRAVRIESSYAVGFLFPEASVLVYHICFPDPWPKRRHHHRRLIQPEFVDALGKTLVQGGEVRFATDHADYFEAAVAVFRERGGWVSFALRNPEPDERTDFEKDFVAMGTSIHRIGFRRLGSAG